MRISRNAIFHASYQSDYDKAIKNNLGSKASKSVIAGQEATRFELSEASVLPLGYSIVSFLVRGLDNTNYLIVFNGDRQEITDELINQIISTFRFIQ